MNFNIIFYGIFKVFNKTVAIYILLIFFVKRVKCELVKSDLNSRLLLMRRLNRINLFNFNEFNNLIYYKMENTNQTIQPNDKKSFIPP